MRVLTLCKKWRRQQACGYFYMYKKVIGAENHNAPAPPAAEEATILSHLLLKITLRKLLPLRAKRAV